MPHILPVASLGTGGSNYYSQRGSQVCGIVPVAAVYYAGVVAWRTPATLEGGATNAARSTFWENRL